MAGGQKSLIFILVQFEKRPVEGRMVESNTGLNQAIKPRQTISKISDVYAPPPLCTDKQSGVIQRIIQG